MLRRLVPALLALAFVAGCSSSGSDAGTPTTAGAGPTSTTASPTSTTSAAPEQYDGDLDGFYSAPKPLPKGAPGDLIRVMDLGTSAGRTSVRVMYHSIDAAGRDRAVTGVVTYPTATAPKGGWPVVSWAHGTTGMASSCAPSRLDAPAPHWGIEAVDVATDYIGMGPTGERLAYLSGASEAHSVIDAVRAARHLTAAHAGTTWLAVGHSQGGHSALFTNQLGQSYAPELDLEGTVVLAPAAVLSTPSFGPQDVVVPKVVGILGLYGMATDHPEVDLADYEGPQLVAAREAGALDDHCMDGITKAYAGIPSDEVYKVDPFTTEPAKSIIEQNDPGKVKVESPLLLIGGTADTWVVPARVDALFERLCGVGQVVEQRWLQGADHSNEVSKGAAVITAWLSDRLAGKPAKDSCPTP